MPVSVEEGAQSDHDFGAERMHEAVPGSRDDVELGGRVDSGEIASMSDRNSVVFFAVHHQHRDRHSAVHSLAQERPQLE